MQKSEVIASLGKQAAGIAWKGVRGNFWHGAKVLCHVSSGLIMGLQNRTTCSSEQLRSAQLGIHKPYLSLKWRRTAKHATHCDN